MARPTDYSQEIASEICSHLVCGGSIASYCRQEDKPTVKTIYNWLSTHDEFLQLYTRAREDQADTLADEMLDISDDSKDDTWVDKDGNERTDTEVVARSKLRIETRKWIASKLKPKKYGDKIEHSGTGESGEHIISFKWQEK